MFLLFHFHPPGPTICRLLGKETRDGKETKMQREREREREKERGRGRGGRTEKRSRYEREQKKA
jgi:hypothetical protein